MADLRALGACPAGESGEPSGSASPRWFVDLSQRGAALTNLNPGHGSSIRDPLPSEAEQPIEDLDGDGPLAAMATLGLDARPWLDAGPAVVADYDGARFPDDGPIKQLQSTHYERYKRPRDEWLSEIAVVERPPREQAPPS